MSQMLVLNSTPYTDVQKRVAVEACRRFGIKPTTRLLAEMWPGNNPGRGTLQMWTHAAAEPDSELEPDQRAEQYWDAWESNHQQRLQAQLAARMPGMLDAMDDLVAKRNGQESKNMAIAVGIFYDKLVPVQRGGGINIIGGTPNFHINTYGPAGSAAEVIEASSREV